MAPDFGCIGGCSVVMYFPTMGAMHQLTVHAQGGGQPGLQMQVTGPVLVGQGDQGGEVGCRHGGSRRTRLSERAEGGR